MKRSGRTAALLAGVCCLTHLAGQADPIVWRATRAEAVERARNSGKLILLFAGRETCSYCQYMKYAVCETPSVRQVIDTNYVAWFCPIDSSTEWYPHATGLGSFSLPLLCVIDPGDATANLDRSTGTLPATAFRDRLSSHLPAHPITITVSRAAPTPLRWTSENQLQYRVLKSEDLVQWSFVGTKMVGDGSPIEYQDSVTATRCFYRVVGFR